MASSSEALEKERQDYRSAEHKSHPLGLPPITYGTQSLFKNRISALVLLKLSENYEKWQQLVEWYS